ncbi:MAG: TetR/AcrR family transcriptional regulator [Caldilineaceae bacterium]|nr:TetR/AcrR family transcriptional regulator [Caldilineaceae bacterium]
MPEELSPRERRHQRTQQAILEAARQIIREEGVDSLSMRAIADRIDYSPAGLYEYFGSKEEIVGGVCSEGFLRLTQRLQSTDPSLPPLDYLVEMGLSYISFAMSNSDFFMLMFTNAPLVAPANFPQDEAPETLLRRSPAFQSLYRAVQRCVDAGVFIERPDFDVLGIAIACWQIVHGISMLNLTTMRIKPIDPARQRVTLRTLLSGFIQG